MRRLREIQRRIEEAILAASILGIAGFTLANVVGRTAFGVSLAWVEELGQFLILTVTFVGLSYAAGQDRHIRMTALTDGLPPRWRARLDRGVAATTGLLLLGLAVVAVGYVDTVRTLGTVSPALRVPVWQVLLVAPVGLGLGAAAWLRVAFVGADAS